MLSSCCGFSQRKIPKQQKGLIWKFASGTSVVAGSFLMAIVELEKVNSRDFWASETQDGQWDVQLSDSVIVPNIKASTVTEAVRTARWKVHLDKSIKKVSEYGSNEF